ncbi:NAD synthetase [Pseudomonas fluorescens]
MTASLLKDGFPSAHRTTRQRIESSIDLRKLFFAIDADPTLIGAGVVYIDDEFNVVTLREFQAVCSVVPTKVVLREAPRYVGPAEFRRMLEHEPRESRVVAEALGTAGTSAVITFIGQAALAASVTQCIVGLGRTGAEAFTPQRLDRLDSEAWYQAVDATLNAIALLGVATSALTTIKTVNTVTKVTGKPLRQVLKGLNRQERAKLNDELLKLRDPRLTSKLLKVRQATGVLPKRISATEMQLATVNHIRDATAATLGFASSSIPGKIKTLAIGVYEEVSQ